VKGTIPTEEFPGAPTLTVFSVRTDGFGVAAAIAGMARVAIATAKTRVIWLRRTRSAALFGICPHRHRFGML
jgi:hypothetical protein